MAQLVYLKENIKYFYQKHSEYLDPAMKLLFSFIMLCLVQSMFQYNEAVINPGFSCWYRWLRRFCRFPSVFIQRPA